MFGIIESWVTEIFLELYDLDRVRFPFIGMIDTRKKILLIKEGLHEKGDLEHDTLLGQIHDLQTLRNVFAHCCFHVAQGGVDIDHVTHHGKMWMSSKDDGSTYISFETFDEEIQKAESIAGALVRLHAQITPISSYIREFTANIEDIIDVSPNVVRFMSRRLKPVL
jgi:hypothetical protein